MITLFRQNLLYRFYSTPIFHHDFTKTNFIDGKKIIDTTKKENETEEKNNKNKDNYIYNSYKNMYSGLPITNLLSKN